MQQLVLRIDDINPDGVRVRINWGAFVVGASFFIPCINVTKGTRQLNAIARSKDVWALSCIMQWYRGQILRSWLSSWRDCSYIAMRNTSRWRIMLCVISKEHKI